VWPALKSKFEEIKAKNDVTMHASMLKLIDILLAHGFSEISYLNFNNNIRCTPVISPRGSIFKDIQPTTMSEIRTCTISLLKQSTEFHSELTPLDTNSIKTSINKEFLRLLHVYSFINFRLQNGEKHPICNLASLISLLTQSRPKASLKWMIFQIPCLID